MDIFQILNKFILGLVFIMAFIFSHQYWMKRKLSWIRVIKKLFNIKNKIFCKRFYPKLISNYLFCYRKHFKNISPLPVKENQNQYNHGNM